MYAYRRVADILFALFFSAAAAGCAHHAEPFQPPDGRILYKHKNVVVTGGPGWSPDEPLVVHGDDHFTAIEAEYAYLNSLDCGGGGRWKRTGQVLLSVDGGMIDDLEVKCSSDGEIRHLYFDITSAYGKW